MKILNKERKPKQISILIIGLNNSGKSTIVNFFKNKDDRKSISVPTVGFNIEHFESKHPWRCLRLCRLTLTFLNAQQNKTLRSGAHLSIICVFHSFNRSVVCLCRSRCFVYSLWHGWHRQISKFMGASLQNMSWRGVRDWFERSHAVGWVIELPIHSDDALIDDVTYEKARCGIAKRRLKQLVLPSPPRFIRIN